MNNIESLLTVHRQDMELLRGESRQARSLRTIKDREMNREFKALRSKIAAEMPKSVTASFMLRGPVTFMLTLLAVLSF
ncbi:hypothetical protein [Maridesulfovibrio ferrireducens]|uniref:hypothetical protein n=1 Tax=Maridesulfovibrio ferrireducens TaxID=246191 RepID=UPI001A223BC3|nr:hypothetical protein [Maridesulfovibrio ferrireducens]MBI9111769.1 hypothetical protein [Maridesulfovibrio ferrireducens]